MVQMKTYEEAFEQARAEGMDHGEAERYAQNFGDRLTTTPDQDWEEASDYMDAGEPDEEWEEAYWQFAEDTYDPDWE